VGCVQRVVKSLGDAEELRRCFEDEPSHGDVLPARVAQVGAQHLGYAAPGGRRADVPERARNQPCAIALGVLLQSPDALRADQVRERRMLEERLRRRLVRRLARGWPERRASTSIPTLQSGRQVSRRRSRHGQCSRSSQHGEGAPCRPFERRTKRRCRRFRFPGPRKPANAFDRAEGTLRLHRLRLGVFRVGGGAPVGREPDCKRAPARGGRERRSAGRYGSLELALQHRQRTRLDVPDRAQSPSRRPLARLVDGQGAGRRLEHQRDDLGARPPERLGLLRRRDGVPGLELRRGPGDLAAFGGLAR